MAQLGFDWRRGALSVKPEIVLASSQQQTFTTETKTPGYTVVNLKASYTIPEAALRAPVLLQHLQHRRSLYRNHSSFIKDLAPEVSRGVRVTYMVRFFWTRTLQTPAWVSQIEWNKRLSTIATWNRDVPFEPATQGSHSRTTSGLNLFRPRQWHNRIVCGPLTPNEGSACHMGYR